jgi:hypothetical protein
MPAHALCRTICIGWMIGLVSIAAGCGGDAPSGRVRELWSEAAVAVLQNPTRVEVYRVLSRAEGGSVPATRPAETRPTTGQTRIDIWPVIGRSAEQDAAFARRLSAVLLDDKSFRWNVAKACTFEPAVVFRVYSGEAYVDVALCFGCEEVMVMVPPADGRPAHRNVEDFDHVRTALVRLTKEAVPNDPFIAALAETR